MENKYESHLNQEQKILLLKNKKILLVEDDEINQFLLDTILKKWNTTVIIANNGQEAIELLQKQNFDLILMDIRMPILDGQKAAKFIKENYKIQTPIIAISADILELSKPEREELGFDATLVKPIQVIDLLDTILLFI